MILSGAGRANIFYKGPGNKYTRLKGHTVIVATTQACVAQTQPQTTHKLMSVAMFQQNFMDTEIWVSYYYSFNFFGHWKM